MTFFDAAILMLLFGKFLFHGFPFQGALRDDRAPAVSRARSRWSSR
jgi:hypothetical protein